MQSENSPLLASGRSAADAVSGHPRARLLAVVAPWLVTVRRRLEAGLARTLAATLEALPRFRHTSGYSGGAAPSWPPAPTAWETAPSE